MLAEKCKHIGKLSKLHGFEGEAVLIADDIFPKKFEKTEWVFIMIDGLPVPFSVLNIHLRSDSSAIIRLDEIASRLEMEQYIGSDVLIEFKGKKTDSTKQIEGSIDGYTVVDLIHGTIGIAKTVINYQQNFLLQVFSGKTEILIPVSDEIIVSIIDEEKKIEVNMPHGLMDLYV